MDKFDDHNWKKIQHVVNKWLGKITEEPSLPKITPILSHAPEVPVRLSSAVQHLAELVMENSELCSYVVTLIEKDGLYKASIQAYLLSPHGEVPILFEQETFLKKQKKEVEEYIRAPFAYFKKQKHLRVITFKNSDMTEEDFDNLIELWRTKPSQIMN